MGKSHQSQSRVSSKSNQKIVLLTGITSELGQQVAQKLSQKGFIVFATTTNKKIAANKNNDAIKTVYMDLMDEASINHVINTILKQYGKIDTFVNIAGVTRAGPIEECTAEEYQKLIDINTVGPFRVIKHLIPVMKDQGWGGIILVTSISALTTFPNYTMYSSTKHALHALGKGLFYELHKYGISVTTIAPGAIAKQKEPSKEIKETNGLKPARLKFPIIGWLLPLVSANVVAEKIVSVVIQHNPTHQIIIGRDAQLIHLFQKLSVFGSFEKMMLMLWERR